MYAYNIKIVHNAWTIPPLRQNNVYLMEVAEEIGLMTIQLKPINACCMYLQVTTLAKITDHTGAQLLPQVLNQPCQEGPASLASISCSMLTWPNVSNLTKATWNLCVAEHPLCPDFLTRIQSLVLVDN